MELCEVERVRLVWGREYITEVEREGGREGGVGGERREGGREGGGEGWAGEGVRECVMEGERGRGREKERGGERGGWRANLVVLAVDEEVEGDPVGGVVRRLQVEHKAVQRVLNERPYKKAKGQKGSKQNRCHGVRGRDGWEDGGRAHDGVPAHVEGEWDPDEWHQPPGALGESLQKVRAEETQRLVDGRVHPLLVVAAHRTNLAQQGLGPVHQLLGREGLNPGQTRSCTE